MTFLFPDDIVRLNAALGLPPLNRVVCHGYQHCCDCLRCRDRSDRARALAGNPLAAEIAAHDSAEYFMKRLAA